MTTVPGWEIETGFLEEYDGTIIDSWFAVDPNYNPDSTLLFLKMSTTDPTTDEITERYPVGKGWMSVDGGETVTDPNRPDRIKFHDNSWYGRLIARVIELEIGPLLVQRGTALEAKVWRGLSFHFEREQKGEGEYKSARAMPTSFLGQAEPTDEQPIANGAIATGPIPDILSGVSSGLLAKMREARTKASDEGSFTDLAMDLPELVGNTNLVRGLSDGSLYRALTELETF